MLSVIIKINVKAFTVTIKRSKLRIIEGRATKEILLTLTKASIAGRNTTKRGTKDVATLRTKRSFGNTLYEGEEIIHVLDPPLNKLNKSEIAALTIPKKRRARSNASYINNVSACRISITASIEIYLKAAQKKKYNVEPTKKKTRTNKREVIVFARVLSLKNLPILCSSNAKS